MSKGNGQRLIGDDLDELNTVDEASVVVLKADGSPMLGSDGEPWRVTVASETHYLTAEARQETMERQREMLQLYGRVTPRQNIQLAIATLAKRTIGWTPIRAGGQDFPYSTANAIDLYTKRSIVREQVENFLSRASSFLASRQQSSLPLPGSSSATTPQSSTGPAAEQ